jgi:hypothetical protein
MTPTNKLRFVVRKTGLHYKHILQQWWEDRNVLLAVYITDKDGNALPPPTRGEWRDVPVEKNHE